MGWVLDSRAKRDHATDRQVSYINRLITQLRSYGTAASRTNTLGQLGVHPYEKALHGGEGFTKREASEAIKTLKSALDEVKAGNRKAVAQ